MKTISPKVKVILDAMDAMTEDEAREFRILLATKMRFYDLGEDDRPKGPEGDSPAGVPRVPKTPVLTGLARRMIDSL
jgi:hypothetical protein